MRLVWFKLFLLCYVAYYADGLDECSNPRIMYMNHTTAYLFRKEVMTGLECGLTVANPAQLMWWRSRDPCGPFESSVACGNSRMCSFDIVQNMDYIYYCCTSDGAEPSTATASQLYCIQIMICPVMANITVTIPPVAFFGENLTFYLALDVSPEVRLTSMITLGGYTNTTFGKTIPSNYIRPRLLYEFIVPLPQSGPSEPVIRVHGRSACNTDINEFPEVFVTSRDPSPGPTPSTLATELQPSSSQPVSQATEGMSDTSSQASNLLQWKLAAIILSCVVVLLILFTVGLSVFCFLKFKMLAAKNSSSSYSVDTTNHVHYNPLGGVSREDSVPSEQIAIVNGAENPIGSQYGVSGHKSETSPPAYQDLTPDRSRPDLSNLTTSSPATVDQRMPLSVLPENPAHLQPSVAQEATPTSTRQPPISLAIQPPGMQHLHTGETPLMGFDTPLNMGSQDPFAQQFAAAAEEVADHVYAKPNPPNGSRHTSRSSGPSEVGSPIGGSSTVFSTASGRSLAPGDGGSVLSGSSVSGVGNNANTNLYSSERIRSDASRVSLSNIREMDSISKDV